MNWKKIREAFDRHPNLTELLLGWLPTYQQRQVEKRVAERLRNGH